MVRRKTYTFRRGGIIEVEEFHDGRYGAPGERRDEKRKPTKDRMQAVNAYNKQKRCRQRLLEYFDEGDCFATLTYQVSRRPEDMQHALADFQKMMRKVRREYAKRGKELRWIRNIERGTKGAWHVHLAVNEIGETASILQRAWENGAVYVSTIRLNDKIYDEDFSKLAAYLTKDENTKRSRDGKEERPRVAESSYGSSRNMPLPEPKVDKLKRWREEPKPKKGYYIAHVHEGVNPVTGHRYRRYTMIRLRKGERKDETGKDGKRNGPPSG